MEELEEVQTIAKYEGMSIQEAKLSYAARQNLPASAFCGPNRSYPAEDAAHVRNGFARLGTFGKKLPKAIAKRIYNCLVSRAKKYGVEHDASKFKWVEETEAEVADTNELIAWFEKEEALTCPTC